MKIVCDSCGTKYSISDDKVRGKVFKIRCKKCSHIIVVRGTNDAAAAQPAAAAEGGWHVVVDGEQVGPVPESDIRARIARGEVNGETYIWKEGFSDWLKISAVPEFADVAGGGVPSAPAASDSLFAESSAPVPVNGTESSGKQRPGQRASGGMFAVGGAGAVAAAAAAEESDVFAAPAPATVRPSGGDLFASAAAAQPAAAEEPRWPAGGASVAAAPHDGGRVESLTGQRHENSVLFSLSNLQSLALPSAAAKPISTSAPTPEGSGLIDIRAMAATTLGAPEMKSSGGMDDLPAFGAFSPAAPVLLPLQQGSRTPKWLYPAIGVMALLVVGIIVMAYKILSTKPVTVVEPAAAPAAPPPEPGARPPAPGATPSAVAAAGATTGTAAEKPAPTIADKDLPPREGPKLVAAESKPERGEHHHGGKGKDKGGKGAVEEKKGAAPAAPVAAAEPEKPKHEKGSIDDLLDNAVQSSRRPAARTRSSDDDSAKKADAPAAGPLSMSQLASGMKSVKPKVTDCYKQYKVGGVAMVNMVIDKSGKVSQATVGPPFAGTPTGSCVEKAVKSASFPASEGLRTAYPFPLR
jgi:predicted Zn finger-like uncharacterized protein